MAPRARIGWRRALAVSVASMALLASCGGDNNQPGEAIEAADAVEDTGWRSQNLPGIASVLGTQRATYEYLIPEGASDRLAAGEALNIVPGRFEAKVGESVKIVNLDRLGHNVGPWYVGPNETLIQKFTSAGVYEGLCTVHPSGALILEVTET